MIPVTYKDISIGAKVMKGPDWKWGDQAKGALYGKVVKVDIEAKVEWVYDTSYSSEMSLGGFYYRISAGTYDLAYYEEPFNTTTILEQLDQLETKLKERRK